MTADAAPGRGPEDPGAGRIVARLSARRATRSGALWGIVFGAVVASSAVSYTSIYTTQADREHLAAAFGANHASAALFGPAPQLQTVAGFTVFKSSLTLTIVGAVWALLLSTSVLRGEEDAGRWEVLCAGRTTSRRATAQSVAGLAAGVAALFVCTAAVIVLAGRSPRVHLAAGPSVFFALALVCAAAMFMAIGALTSQLAASRRQAASLAAIVLGASYGLRMVADAGIGLHGLVWASPLGWVEELRPLTAPHPVALVPIAALVVVCAGAAVHLSGRRDVGAGLLASRTSAPARLGLLSGPAGLAARTLRPVILGWWIAIACTGALMGLVAKAAGATISGSSVSQVFARLGAPGEGTRAYLGVAFLTVAVLVAFAAAGQVTAARDEEAEGRLDQLAARPVSRWRWLGTRLGVAIAVLVVSGLLAGISTWAAAASQRSGVGVGSLLAAGLNVVAPALCLLGSGVLAFGVWPRWTAAVVYGLLAWSLLIEVVGGIGSIGHWVADTSLFHQISAAPAVAPNWTVDGVLVALGAAGALVGAGFFRSRDLQGT